jgi:hypothetical protein
MRVSGHGAFDFVPAQREVCYTGVAPVLACDVVPGRRGIAAAAVARTRRRYATGMCRNIRTLYNFDPPATDEEIRASALQYVRKISGFNKPSRANEEAFERALDAVIAASARLLSELETTAPPKDREVEAAKARARSAQRYAA